jgi:hypothetical protein
LPLPLRWRHRMPAPAAAATSLRLCAASWRRLFAGLFASKSARASGGHWESSSSPAAEATGSAELLTVAGGRKDRASCGNSVQQSMPITQAMRHLPVLALFPRGAEVTSSALCLLRWPSPLPTPPCCITAPRASNTPHPRDDNPLPGFLLYLSVRVCLWQAQRSSAEDRRTEILRHGGQSAGGGWRDAGRWTGARTGRVGNTQGRKRRNYLRAHSSVVYRRFCSTTVSCRAH